MYFKKSVLSLAITSSLLLAACGGGGGGGNGNGTPTTPTTEQAGTVQGTAVKGALRNAAVTAYELSDEGTRVRTVGQGTSDSSGRYSVTLDGSYQGGPIEIEVASTADTQMLCDAVEGCGSTAFGAALPVPEGFKMSALIAEAPQTAGTTLEAAVTPWTHMAAARAKTLIGEGTSAKTAALKAVSETSQIVGFDINATKAADLSAITAGTGTAAELKYAAVNAALAAILLSDTSSAAAIATKLDQLAESFSDGKFDDTDDIKIGEIKQSLSTVLQSEQFTDVADESTNGQLTNLVTQLPDSGEYNPEPVSDDLLTGDNITVFKAFANQVRAWMGTLQEADFDTPLDALDLDVQTVQETLNNDTVGTTQLLGEILGQTLDYLNAHPSEFQVALSSQGTITVPISTIIEGDIKQDLGSITVAVATTEGVSLTLNGSVTGASSQNTVTVEDLVLATNIPASAFNEGVFNSFTASQATLKLAGQLSDAKVTLNLNEVSLTIATATDVTFSETLGEESLGQALQSAALVGDLSITHTAGASFAGQAGVELVRLDASVPNPTGAASLKKLEVSGSFTGSKGSFSASAKLNVTNASLFDTFGYLDYLEADEPEACSVSTPLPPDDQMAGSDSVTNDITPERTFDPCGEMESEEPEADAFENSTYFAQGSLTVGAALKLPEIPEAKLTATFNRTKLYGGSLNATVQWDEGSYNIALAVEDASGEQVPAKAEISNSAGHRLILQTVDTEAEDLKLTGAAYVGDTKVGDVETTDSGIYIIRYTDGSFESLY